jgi:hypothetical protein
MSAEEHMRRWMTLATLVTIVSSATPTRAQARPDFTGSWIIDQAKSDVRVPPPASPPRAGVPPPPPPPQETALTIRQTRQQLNVDRTMGQGQIYKTVYSLDGTDSTNQTGPVATKSKASWEGNTLVLAGTSSVDDRPIGETKETFSLNGDTLIVETTRATPRGAVHSRLVYHKER